MRVIAAGLHRMLDFVTVLGFALAPVVLGLTGLAATLAYVLAAVHLALTLLTHFPGRAARPVSLVLHGAIEGVVPAVRRGMMARLPSAFAGDSLLPSGTPDAEVIATKRNKCRQFMES